MQLSGFPTDFSRQFLRRRVPVRLAILGLDLQRAEPAAQKRSRLAPRKQVQHIGAGRFMLPSLEFACIDGDRGCYDANRPPVDLMGTEARSAGEGLQLHRPRHLGDLTPDLRIEMVKIDEDCPSLIIPRYPKST